MNLFIGSSSVEEIPQKYLNDTKIYLDKLLKDNNLIFGAYNHGIMGLSYEAALNNNNEITSIVPELNKNDLLELNSTKEIITKDTPDRTTAMFKSSDALIFLPGGIGTLYELFASLECTRNHEVNVPIIIYNSCNFFDEILTFLDKLYEEKFIKTKVKELYHISNNAEDTLEFLNNYYK